MLRRAFAPARRAAAAIGITPDATAMMRAVPAPVQSRAASAAAMSARQGALPGAFRTAVASAPAVLRRRTATSMSGLTTPQDDPRLARVASQAFAAASARPADAGAQLTYLSMLYRLNRNQELLDHVRSGRFASNGQIRDLADAAAAKMARGAAEEAEAANAAAGGAAKASRLADAPSRPAGVAPAADGSPMMAYGYPPPGHGYPPPGGHGGYPPPGGHGGYPPPGGYGGYPPPGGYGGYPPPGGQPPPAPPSSGPSFGDSSSFSSSSSSSSSRGSPLGSEANPVKVQTVSRFGFPEAMRMLLGAALWLGGIALVMYVFNQVMGGKGGGAGGGLADLMRSDNAGAVATVPETRFDDVMGVDEAKTELQDVVEYLRHPEKFSDVGAHIPKGVLLSGPPGTGKTLLARAVAGEAGVKFFARSASEFEEMLVGLGARRVREMFDTAKKEAPAIIFIDEIDAMGAKRGRVSVGSGSERQTLNQLLACMDGFAKTDNVIVIAATNNPEVLDDALVRPGRFDSRVDVPLPDVRGRREIIDLYLGRVQAGEGIDSALLAAATPGMSGAAIATMINSAAIAAAKAGRRSISPEDLEEARDKTWMGPAMRSRRRTLAEMELTAYHEGGHTLAGLLTPASQELHKVTILPRGPAGGVTFFLEDDNAMTTRSQLLARLDVAMGGRVAEELIYGHDEVTTGASSDMQSASRIARAYVRRFSMGAHAIATYSSDDGDVSEAVRARIDREVEDLLAQSYARVSKLLAENRPMLDRLAKALLQHETLTAEECRAVAVEGKALPPPAELVKARRTAAKGLAAARAKRILDEDAAVAAVRGTAPKPETPSGGGIWGAVFGSETAKPAKEEPQEEAAEPEPPVEPAPQSGEDKKGKPKKWV